jgi:hypothetical protein
MEWTTDSFCLTLQTHAQCELQLFFVVVGIFNDVDSRV